MSEKSCKTCAYHDPNAQTVDQAPSHCWPCSSASTRGGALPHWTPKPGERRVKAGEAPASLQSMTFVGNPLREQVGGSHYKDLGIQPIEVMKSLMTPEEVTGFLKGNVLKYSIRQGRKPGSDDANKARHYEALLAAHMAEIGK